ncbi:MAG: acyl-CoA dehydrogenase family protein [Candidatus Marinimicrobia bacterium]|nr:acyl-CoA dehydrogenase family protein [Candidatus Neomarinimicrobiota bacterium]
MSNFFTENQDIQFQFNRIDLEKITRIREKDYTEAEKYPFAPRDYEDAKDNFRRILEVVGDIAGNFVAERAREVDELGSTFEDGKVTYARGLEEALERLNQAGLMGFILERKYGGLNLPISLYIFGIEMVSRGDASLMNLFGLQDISETIENYASDEIKEEFLPKFSSGEVTGAMVLTEPDAGSDLQAVKTRAYQDENGNWFLSGVKRFITNGNADVCLVLARSEEGTRDGRGLSLFVCYGDDTVQIRRIEHKLGIKGSPTCEMQFHDTPAKLIGSRKRGLIAYVMSLMNGARLGVAAQALGIAQAAYVEARRYASEREQFGKPILNFPAVAEMLIRMKVDLESSRTLIYDTAHAVDMHKISEMEMQRLQEAGESISDIREESKQWKAMADFLTPLSKFVISEKANRICYDAIQIHGGTGYMQEFNVERHFRDVRITNIYEGTSQLQVIAAIGGVIKGVADGIFDANEAREYRHEARQLANKLAKIRSLMNKCKDYVLEKDDKAYQELHSAELVEMYGSIYVGYILLDEAAEDSRKMLIAKKYIMDALATALHHTESITRGFDTLFADVEQILTRE